MTSQSVSVLLSVYEGETAEHVESAIESMVNQTVAPDEFVIVKDGPLTPELEKVIEKWDSSHPSLFKILELEENKGLGVALQTGIESCSNEFVARMDADDVAIPERIEKQLEFFQKHPEVDAVGGYVAEFEDNPSNANHIRTVPISPEETAKKARFRNPMNHPTIMYRRESVLDAGNYRGLRSMQDYDLWVRMLLTEKKLDNVPEVLVYARAGKDLYSRRGGMDYVKTEYRLQRDFLKWGFISLPIFVINMAARTAVRLVPNKLREQLYKKLFRTK